MIEPATLSATKHPPPSKNTAKREPTYENVYTTWGSVALKRIAPQEYRVLMEGVDIGSIRKKNKFWHAGQDINGHPDRTKAIKGVITAWTKAKLSRQQF